MVIVTRNIEVVGCTVYSNFFQFRTVQTRDRVDEIKLARLDLIVR